MRNKLMFTVLNVFKTRKMMCMCLRALMLISLMLGSARANDDPSNTVTFASAPAPAPNDYSDNNDAKEYKSDPCQQFTSCE